MSRQKKRRAQSFENSLEAHEREQYDACLLALMAEVTLPEKEARAIQNDFSKAIAYYHGQGLAIQEAASRIGPDILGGFYVPADPKDWYPLDSAAKVYPLSLTHTSMSVFRVSAYLAEAVVPEILQVALLSTIKRFPVFATTIRKGFFWHYLDATRRRFTVQPEKGMPCQPIKVSGRNAVSFRVQYHDKRVSLEVFHILTDGTGAMAFLKTLVREYLRLLGKAVPAGPEVLDVSGPVRPGELENAFSRGDAPDKAEGFVEMPAAQIGGRRTFFQPCKVLHYIMPADAMRVAAKSMGTTVTGLVLSAMFVASAGSLNKPRPRSRLHIQVPVNMRKFYPSQTLRNFSMYSVLKLRVEDVSSLEAAIPLVDRQLRETTAKASLDRMVAMTNALVENPLLRYTPLVLKRFVFRWVYKLIGERTLTTTLSNLGIADNPFGNELDMYDFMLGASGTNNVNCGLITVQGKAVLTLTKSTLDNRFESRMCELLTGLGITMDIEEAAV